MPASFPFKDFWSLNTAFIPHRVDTILDYAHQLYEQYGFFPVKEIAESIFGFSSKQANKIVASQLFKESEAAFDFALIYKIVMLSKICGLNRDQIFQAVQKTEKEFMNCYTFNKRLIKDLLNLYSEKRVIELIINSEFEITDVERMFEQLKSMGFEQWHYLPRKPKSLFEIHNKLSAILTRLSCDDFDLEQKEDVLELDNKKVFNGELTIRVPKTHIDLVELGERLNFCIGNGHYSREVKNGKCSIVAVFNDEKPLYAIQFSRYSIRQAYGFNNSHLPKDILSAIENYLIAKPEVPQDFIQMESSFIYGYKYDNVNMYFMLSNGGIYMYENVSNETYERFLEARSKGSFFSKVIKKEHECTKIE